MYLYRNSSNIEFDDLNVYYNNRHLKIWNLLDSLGYKKSSKSMKIYNQLVLGGVSFVPIIISLAALYSELISNDTGSQNKYNGLIS